MSFADDPFEESSESLREEESMLLRNAVFFNPGFDNFLLKKCYKYDRFERFGTSKYSLMMQRFRDWKKVENHWRKEYCQRGEEEEILART